MKLKSIPFFLVSLLFLFSCKDSSTPELSDKDFKNIGYQAFVYSYPMLAHVKQINTYLANGALVQNELKVVKGFSTEDTIADVTSAGLLPNTAGILIDITEGPLIIDIPKIRDRYVVYQCVDLFTYNIFYFGTRASFGNGGRLVFYKEGQGLPNDQSIQAIMLEGNQAVFLMGFQETEPSEVGVLNNFLEEVKVVYAPNEISDYPSYDEEIVFTPNFVSYVNDLVDSIPSTEKKLYESFKVIGIKDTVTLTPNQNAAVQKGIDSAITVIKEASKGMVIENGYSSSRGYYGNRTFLKDSYLKRATAAYTQLWSDSQEESIWYKSKVGGAGEISFTKEELPPLKENGFITVTVRDQNKKLYGKSLLFSKKDLDAFNSLDLIFSEERQKGYWLQTPKDDYTITIQVFLPELSKISNFVPPMFQRGL